MIERIPKEVVDILKLINKQRYEAFIIGGAVRDLLMYRTPKDYDICTDMPLEEIKKVLPRFHIMKPSPTRNTGIIVVDNIPIEISIYRGKTLMQDMLKRDFTINAIAYSHTDGLIDYFGFRNDVFEKRIKLIDKTDNSLTENPIIILRALRLSGQLNCEIDLQTKERIIKSSHLLDTVKPERITKELITLLSMENFPNIFIEYKEIFNKIFSNLLVSSKEKYNNTIKLISILPNNHVLRLAALFINEDNNIETFYKFARKLNLDNKTIKSVISILKYGKVQLKTGKNDIFQLIREVAIHNVDLIFLFQYAQYSINNQDKTELLHIQALYQAEIDKIVQTKVQRLVINKEKIEELGYSSIEATHIYNTIVGQIINNELPNSDTSLKQYILKHYKRS